MAQFAATLAFSINDLIADQAEGVFTQASPSQIIFQRNDGGQEHYTGSFAYGADGALAGGTFTGFAQYVPDPLGSGSLLLWWQLHGGNYPVSVVVNYLSNNDSAGLMAYMLGGADSMRGGNFHDQLAGYAGNDTLHGAGGNDLVIAHTGNDILYGNQGDDTLYGNQGADVLYGGQDSDVMYGGQDADALYGNLGNDQLFGNLANDYMHGGAGNDYLHGGAGDDTLDGGVGNDVLVGGLGLDSFIFENGGGNDTVSGVDAADIAYVRTNINGSGIVDFASLMAHATASGAGTLFDLGGGNSVEVLGVAIQEFTAADFVFY